MIGRNWSCGKLNEQSSQTTNSKWKRKAKKKAEKKQSTNKKLKANQQRKDSADDKVHTRMLKSSRNWNDDDSTRLYSKLLCIEIVLWIVSERSQPLRSKWKNRRAIRLTMTTMCWDVLSTLFCICAMCVCVCRRLMVWNCFNFVRNWNHKYAIILKRFYCHEWMAKWIDVLVTSAIAIAIVIDDHHHQRSDLLLSLVHMNSNTDSDNRNNNNITPRRVKRVHVCSDERMNKQTSSLSIRIVCVCMCKCIWAEASDAEQPTNRLTPNTR